MDVDTGLQAELINRVLFTRWVTAPGAEEVEAMEERLAEAIQRLASPVIYVAALDSRLRIPNASERGQLNRLARVVRRYCETAHFIVEGDELQHSMVRVILSGMMMATRLNGDFLRVHQGAAEALRALSPRLREEGEPLFRQARERGLLE